MEYKYTEYKGHSGTIYRYLTCTKCGCFLGSSQNELPNFCSNCGKRIKDSTNEDTLQQLKSLQQAFDSYRETAEEISLCYVNCHSDSWILETALRQIADKSFYECDNLGAYVSVEKQKQMALNALELVWERREIRSKK